MFHYIDEIMILYFKKYIVTNRMKFLELINHNKTHQMKVYINYIYKSDNNSVMVLLPTDNTGQIPSGVPPKPIYGLLGMITLLAGPYLAVVTGRQKVGCIAGQDIWRLQSAEIICIQRSLTHLSDTQVSLIHSLRHSFV